MLGVPVVFVTANLFKYYMEIWSNELIKQNENGENKKIPQFEVRIFPVTWIKNGKQHLLSILKIFVVKLFPFSTRIAIQYISSTLECSSIFSSL